ncbi:hypothetical protein A3C59_03145 [Candidatus Daviesbacteria bacterium RIFCSPHIGHO2_02_FULL_36_13]|uniref:Glycosyltransferase RgtA/B/C/D-like domain-containing protein n=1 Tax=Candidatus Daviesbacteria bacterium RIFCSPHIGHO2_02_FULL_36_13 TaxID=1797768 RepID=A0A1F5JQ13_9BACT|nr:MAG: hypothetical protein A3C59_03145 [Candidatus Daviesbacteria bacterium RIFCSPHIGHO2_02_FULL_36_13]OGE44663.1 MAG: hypothetical protein A3A45_02315 [Candidatus Daviesbacteria bacterium RIFCSPLOWO2_01_FULL_36_8]
MQKIFLLGLLLLSLLLFKNPFSSNNIISNLEPSPDSIHYLNPVKSFTEGKGLNISYQDRIIPAHVPPLYSLIITPFYLLTSDIRSFYFTNIILALISAILFFKIVTGIFKSRTISILLYLSFCANLIVFLYPSFAMAENLLMTLYLLSIWLLIRPPTQKTVIALSFLAVAFFATKYVAWILSLSLIFITSFIVIKKAKHLTLILFSSLICFFLTYVSIEYLTKGLNIFERITGSIPDVFRVFQSFFQTVPSNLPREFFSKNYFENNFIRFLGGITGGPAVVAGAHFVILPITVGMVSIFAIFLNLLSPKNRILSFYFFISILATIYYISTFFVADSRYLLEFIPGFLIIFGLFLERVCNFLYKIKREVYAYILLIFCWISIFFNTTPAVVNQIKINFFGTGKSGNYEAIETMNKFTNKLEGSNKPIIISVLSPYQIDFFSNKKYDLLPISKQQYFIPSSQNVWGIDLQNYSLSDIYKGFLEKGRRVYVSNYLTGEKYWYKFDLLKIKENFNLISVFDGCSNQCSVYELKLKN